VLASLRFWLVIILLIVGYGMYRGCAPLRAQPSPVAAIVAGTVPAAVLLPGPRSISIDLERTLRRVI
jgi:hypothetical protein